MISLFLWFLIEFGYFNEQALKIERIFQKPLTFH